MEKVMDKVVALCKRRGYVFPSSEIYGGISACWDYGPLGARLKNNVKRLWWRAMTQLRDDIEEVANEFADGDLLSRLRESHDITAYRFDEGSNPVEIASLPKLTDSSTQLTDPLTDASYERAASLRRARVTATVAGVFLLIALVAGAVYLIGRRRPLAGQQMAWSLLVSMLAFIVSAVVLAVASLRSPDVGVQMKNGTPNAPAAYLRRLSMRSVSMDLTQIRP